MRGESQSQCCLSTVVVNTRQWVLNLITLMTLGLATLLLLRPTSLLILKLPTPKAIPNPHSKHTFLLSPKAQIIDSQLPNSTTKNTFSRITV